MSQDEPFGRQPKPVVVTIAGERVDVEYWIRTLAQRAEFKGDQTQICPGFRGDEGSSIKSFTIYPRAVND